LCPNLLPAAALYTQSALTRRAAFADNHKGCLGEGSCELGVPIFRVFVIARGPVSSVCTRNICESRANALKVSVINYRLAASPNGNSQTNRYFASCVEHLDISNAFMVLQIYCSRRDATTKAGLQQVSGLAALLIW
jgi:hypothetical protein